MIGRVLLAIAGALSLPLLNAPAAARTPHPPAVAVILDDAGVAFPERLGNLSRREVLALSPDMLLAHYRLVRANLVRASVHIYVLREPMSVAQAFEYVERSDARDRPNRQRLGPIAVAAPGGMGRLWRGELDGIPLFFGHVRWEQNGWQIWIRCNAMAADGAGDWQEVQRLIWEFSSRRLPRRRARPG